MKRIYEFLLGIPLLFLFGLVMGFVVVGLCFIIFNLVGGTFNWIIEGIFKIIVEWTIIWTRVSIVGGIIIGLFFVIAFLSEIDG